MVAYWSFRGFAEFSLNAWKQKKKKICRFLQTGSVLGVLLSVWPVHLLPDCVGVKSQPDVKAYDFLMSFFGHMSSPKHMGSFANSLVCAGAF